MANPASIFDQVDEERLQRAVDEARAAAAAGHVVPHEVVAEWLEKLAKGERPPPPLSTTKR